MIGELHICWRRVVEVRRIVDACTTCQRRTRKVGEFEEMYGWTVTCCACGEVWQDGSDGLERRPRPFERGWRQRSAERAKHRWVTAGSKRGAP
jgi:hypothetical protein